MKKLVVGVASVIFLASGLVAANAATAWSEASSGQTVLDTGWGIMSISWARRADGGVHVHATCQSDSGSYVNMPYVKANYADGTGRLFANLHYYAHGPSPMRIDENVYSNGTARLYALAACYPDSGGYTYRINSTVFRV